MIGKIVKGRSFKGCISYVLADKDANILASEGVLETDVKSIINSFYMQSLLNPNVSKCVGHIPLAFSPDDKERMTDHFMERLAKEYMKLMGIENTQYIIVRHNNTSHPHCHIVFNRIDNDGKTITDRNDQYRNEKVCKQLKDKYNLTYGQGKDRVNVQKLKGAEQTKYEIYHAVKETLPKAKNWKYFEEVLKQKDVSIEYKRKVQTNEIQGISFKKGEHSFKGSEIDRKFNYSKLDAQLTENSYSQEQQQYEQQQVTIPKKARASLIENAVSGVADAISSIGGLFDIQPSNYDMNEAEALPRKKKKKPIKRKGIRR
ncbi:relaxase/mobilization nuclease domain-containing protein [Massilibacteroides sp.]|uniref:relaxase/mobilization nuclease domain-containing protein n=1 Tax=Massilibacteroides sp. TaxID=2034766 RepID=UPI0026399D1F|nr:relaxase/mobilization nuclease domain-containing protein [Massilibacteroides sp.]MDD4516664.1 relaxase/mobilization nuclease domain-containing protein [Massilibacteroides sp.]